MPSTLPYLLTSLAAVFSPTPGTPGKVVGGVAAHRGVDHVVRGLDARPLLDPRLVVERVVRHTALVVEHLDVRILDQLVHVAVAGDDDDVVAGVAAWVARVANTSSAS